MATCQNPRCGKDVSPIDIFAVMEEKGVTYFCDEKCYQESKRVSEKEEAPVAKEEAPTAEVKRDAAPKKPATTRKRRGKRTRP